MRLGLSGQVVLLTGPTSGMGPDIALAFAEEGARLGLLTREPASVEGLAADIAALGSEAEVFACDITDEQSCAAAAAAARSALGPAYALINVAGGSGPIGKTGVETTRDEFHDILDLNTTGIFNMIRAVAPAMIAEGRGRIVSVGGTFGMRGRAGRLAYSASKWGLRGVTKSFALELGPHGITVNTVAPGMVDGPRFRDKVCANMVATQGITMDEAARRHAADYALGRVSTARDVANACVFLASEAARQITGVDLPVDGGWAAL
ncbi:SDR family oxidoreductase [Roseibacterium sp. SDUM158016]|uniref:SDR family NAD(P)-dependent oxidoreductase n=1 Tax=Roseicyclus sediminis TaxID=2980997 RepID=UPI0021CFC451|nr:SDR family NAD(P)-dependent oxidoreductase [Roseibacterium sp. SDUM158016]MCU4651803.1 SDR family oxidoreductase [Roseibacterium sp. SDUM158016]